MDYTVLLTNEFFKREKDKIMGALQKDDQL